MLFRQLSLFKRIIRPPCFRQFGRQKTPNQEDNKTTENTQMRPTTVIKKNSAVTSAHAKKKCENPY